MANGFTPANTNVNTNPRGFGGVVTGVLNNVRNAQDPGLAPASPGGPAFSGTGGFGLTPSGQLPALDLSTVTDTSGSNAIFNSLQNTVQRLAPVNAQVQAAQLGAAPQFAPAQGTAASGTAAQGAAATGTASQMGASAYNAALANAAGYNPSQGQASTMTGATGTASGYNAALGANAAGVGGVSGTAALAGSPALAGFAQLLNAAQGGYAQVGPTNVSTAGDAAFMAQQQRLADILGTQAAGGGVSPADLQLAAGRDANVASQLAVLGSQRGNMGNAALAARAAADQGANADAQLNQQMGIQRAQETLAAQNALGNVLGTARGQAQNYNLNQAQIDQQTALANLGNAQAATMGNTGFRQQGLIANLSDVQQSILANQSAQNQNAQFNAGQSQAMNLANMNLGLQGQEFNAGAQNTLLGQNLSALNAAHSFDAGNAQAMTLANMQSQNSAASLNAQQAQAMTLADMLAQNTAGQFNAGNMQQTALANQGATNAALSQSSAQSQAAALANMQATNSMTGLNLQNMNAMDLANLQATNAFGLNNVNNAQAMALANLGNAQQSNLANQSILGQFGLQQGSMNQQATLANQQAALQSQQQFMGQYLASLGLAGTVDQQQAQNQLAAQQLISGQNIAQANINAGLAVNNSQANANLLGAGIGAGGALLGGLLAASDENLKTGIEGGNPMLQSFLDDYRASVRAQGDSLRAAPRSAPFAMPSMDGSALGAGISSASGSLTDAFRKLIGQHSAMGAMRDGVASGQAADYAAQGAGPGLGAESGATLPPPTLSDDQAKENVISGNRGMQAFLEQANAQQQAQSNQGSTNNAFLQTGQAPSAQVDRQLPSYLSGNPNAGYGMNPGIGGPSFAGPTTFGAIGVTPSTGVGQGTAGGFQAGQNTNAAMGTQGSVFTGTESGAGFHAGGAPTAATTFGGGLANQGGLSGAGITSEGGIQSPGGVTSGPSVTSTGSGGGGGLRSGGGQLQANGQVIPPMLGQPGSGFVVAKPSGPARPPPGSIFTNVNPPPTATAPSTPATTRPITPAVGNVAPPPAPLPTLVGSLGPGTIQQQPIARPTSDAVPAFSTVNLSQLFAPTAMPPELGFSMLSDERQKTDVDDFPIATRSRGRQNFDETDDEQSALDNADPNVSPSAGYMPMEGPSWRKLPGASDYNYFHTPTNINKQAAAEAKVLSDEHEKSAASRADVDAMLDKLHAYSYRYKDPTAPGAAPGRRVGVMAQDLEKSPLGASFVRDTPQGKMVDYGQAAGTMMAGLAYHNERLDQHEDLLRQILAGAHGVSP